MFGPPKPQAQPNPQPNVFGGSTLTLGQSMAQRGASTEPPTVPGVRIDMNNVRPTTRFHDLEPELSKAITNVDDNIQNYQRQAAETSQLYNSMIPLTDSIAPDVDYITQKLANAELALENDAAAIHSVRQIVILASVSAVGTHFASPPRLKCSETGSPRKLLLTFWGTM